MSLPTLAKTWQFNVNQAIAAQGSQQATNRRLLRAIKDSLIGFTSSPWATRYSCDSLTAGTAGDGIDRWTADTSVVGNSAGSAHSWFVMRQTGIATNFELLISCENSSTLSVIVLAVSPSAGFTGGTTTARPTATDEIVLLTTGNTWNSGADVNHKLHVMQSSDGQVTRVMLWENNINCLFWAFEKPKNPPSGWTNPSTSFAMGGASTATFQNLSAFLTAGGGQGSSKGRGTATFAMTWTGEGSNSSSSILANGILNAPNDFDSSWPFFPIGLVSTQAGHRGRHGTLFDIWWGSSGTASADTYPADGSRQFAQLANIILPWNGSTPLIT
jgi:hypothetical protein